MCCYQRLLVYSKSNSTTWLTCSYNWMIQVTWALAKSTRQYQVSQPKAAASTTFHLTSNQYALLLRISSLGPFLRLPVSTSLVSSFVLIITPTAVRELFLHMAVGQTRFASLAEQMASLEHLDRYVESLILYISHHMIYYLKCFWFAVLLARNRSPPHKISTKDMLKLTETLLAQQSNWRLKSATMM